jgi:hypothetical protein
LDGARIVAAVAEVEVEVEDVENLLVLDPPLPPVGLPPNPKAVKLYTGSTSDVGGKTVAAEPSMVVIVATVTDTTLMVDPPTTIEPPVGV